MHVLSLRFCNRTAGEDTIESTFMDTHTNRRLAAILLGFVYIGFFLACDTSQPNNEIPAPVTRESGDADFAELLNSIFNNIHNMLNAHYSDRFARPFP